MKNRVIENVRSDKNAIIAALTDAGAVFKGTSVKCPFHDDVHPSGGLYEKDGVWRFKCHTPACGFCGDVFDVQAKRQGRQVEDLLREHAEPEPKAKPPRIFPTVEDLLKSIGAYATVEDHYAYTNPSTMKPDMVIVRCRDTNGKKTFLQAKPVDGGFVQRAPAKPWPIFNRSRIATADRVICAEGEKCVKIFQGLGFVATTSPGGAENAKSADWSPLAGKTLYLWADNDPAGMQYMRDVSDAVMNLSPAPSVHRIPVEEFDLPAKADIFEYIDLLGGDTRESMVNAIETALSLAQSFGPSAAVDKIIQSTIDGTRRAVDFPFTMLSEMTNALLPGSITVICGDPGSSKSFLLMQSARKWLDDGIKYALYQLETDEDGSHLLRAVVQESKEPDLLNPRWIAANGERAKQIARDCREFSDAFGRRLTTPPREPPTLIELIEWVEKQAQDGCRIIAVDPVTAAEGSDKPWRDDKTFILSAQGIMRKYGASLVLVTHPRKGVKGSGTGDDMAGGKAYFNFVQTVIWVRSYQPRKLCQCNSSFGKHGVEINRSIKMTKTRLGAGGGMELGYIFTRNMEFAEQGLMVKDVKKSIESASDESQGML